MAVLSENSLGLDVGFLVVDHNPRKADTNCAKGSMIVYVNGANPFAKPEYFYKLDDGPSQNVMPIIKRHNYSGGVAPAAADDASAGFHAGSEWYDGTNLYKCVDDASGAAVWMKIA